MVHGPKGRPRHAKRNQRRRMAVHDGLNVRTRPINRCVNEAFEVNGAPADIDRSAFEVKLQNVFGGDQARRDAARQQETRRVLLVADADVAKSVDDALIVKDPICVNEILNQGGFLVNGRGLGRWGRLGPK